MKIKSLLPILLLIPALLIVQSCFKGGHKYGTVIVLNGPSAAGKSSAIKAFQNNQNSTWLGIGVDNFFVGVIPQKLLLEGPPEKYELMKTSQSTTSDGKPIFAVEILS